RRESEARRESGRTSLRSVAHCTLGELATAASVGLVVTAAWILYLPLVDHRFAGGDTTTYLEMARNPKGVHWVPLAYRGLEPWLAHALGGPDHYVGAFMWLTWGSLLLAGVALYLIVRRLGGPHPAGLVGMAGAMSLPMWTHFLFDPYLVDGPALALLAWSMLALINGWYAVLPLLLVLTGVARETVIGFVVPIYMWLRQKAPLLPLRRRLWAWVDLSAAWRTILFMAPAVVTIWAMRQATTYLEDSSTLGLMKYGLLQYVGTEVVPRPLFFLTYGIAGSLGLWWVLGLYGRRHGGRLWWMLVPVFAQWLFGSDYGRYALYAFPVVVAAGVIAVWEHPRRVLLLALVAVQSLVTIVDVELGAGPRLYTLLPSTWIALGLMAAAVVILWWPSRQPALPQQRDATLVG
ncbi:MAG: hypothetical protein IRY85_12580, partial [Micromonosporaceae bacterium]|nr:hypothetical protein [Micromonosporaceae bacterium]